jgi:DnaJ-class molecular chaperone
MKYFVVAIIPVFFLACTGKPEIIEAKCSSCHSTDVVYQKKRTPEAWDVVIFGMKARGMKITPEEEREIKDVLVKRYGVR